MPPLETDRHKVVVWPKPAPACGVMLVDELPVEPDLNTIVRPNGEDRRMCLPGDDPAERVADYQVVRLQDFVERNQIALGPIERPTVLLVVDGNGISHLRVGRTFAAC